MLKILLSEPIDDSGIQLLEGRAEIVFCPEPTVQAIGRLIKDVDASDYPHRRQRHAGDGGRRRPA